MSFTSLPSIYESTSLLTVKPPTISSNLVQSLSNEDLSQRLSTINQEVLSRSSLEPMVQKYDLYKQERATGLPMELIIEKMYKNIKVDPRRNAAMKRSRHFASAIATATRRRPQRHCRTREQIRQRPGADTDRDRRIDQRSF